LAVLRCENLLNLLALFRTLTSPVVVWCQAPGTSSFPFSVVDLVVDLVLAFSAGVRALSSALVSVLREVSKSRALRFEVSSSTVVNVIRDSIARWKLPDCAGARDGTFLSGSSWRRRFVTSSSSSSSSTASCMFFVIFLLAVRTVESAGAPGRAQWGG
jgi:hypothetical protein